MESIEIIIYNFRLWVNPTGSWPKDNALKGPVKLDERCFAKSPSRASPNGASAISPDVHVRAVNE
ncbi:MAG: hypothetical protein H8E29_01670 [Anaerolineales bacterium]|uniref:Uncharacterized protein n=1 Tax=Candidatus Desulfolinea nitratireducens TaxID=2841698 RepID=A0A8J6NHY3_9CHLR|nr:hypothetical protein [Candidatus Desulfolinea nitratireducens]